MDPPTYVYISVPYTPAPCSGKLLLVGMEFREAQTDVRHCASVRTPVAEQYVDPDGPYPDGRYPALHAGSHAVPSAIVELQVPRPPVVGAVTPVHIPSWMYTCTRTKIAARH